jgi:tRNA (guanine-N7-)-methyltransferase
MNDDESEFGVPFPGVILPREQWADTALRRLPTRGCFDWQALFGLAAPVVLDLGCGSGRSVLVSAVARPACDHLGVDVLPLAIRYAVRRANQRGLGNVRFAVADAREIVQRLVPPGSVSEVHIYHPQPYPDLADAHRRLITPAFLIHVHHALTPGYWQYMKRVIPCFFDLREQAGPWPDASRGKTRREIIALQRGLDVFRGVGTARMDLDAAAALAQAERLPPPVFAADRRLRELDELERAP